MRRLAAAAAVVVLLAAGWAAWQRGWVGAGLIGAGLGAAGQHRHASPTTWQLRPCGRIDTRLDALPPAAPGSSPRLPLTLPAHSSLLTGTFPTFHGVRDNGGSISTTP
ncbi:MAG: hypothetical protein R2712_04280 [Vicinamibacterales bacterium]